MSVTVKDLHASAAFCYQQARRQIVAEDIDTLEPEVIAYALDQAGWPRTNIEKVHAMILLRTAPQFYMEDPDVHEKVAIALAGRPVVAGMVQDAHLYELLFARFVARSVVFESMAASFGEPIDDFMEAAFSDAVLEYWAGEVEEEGLCVPPPGLEACQGYLDMRLAPHARDMASQVRAYAHTSDTGIQTPDTPTVKQQREILDGCIAAYVQLVRDMSEHTAP